MKVYGSIMVGLMAFMMWGCSAEESATRGADAAIEFTAKISWSDQEDNTPTLTQSRASSFADPKVTFTRGDNVGVLAFKTPRSWTEDKNTGIKPTHSYNNKLTFLSRTFSCESPIYYPYPPTEKVSILAYYPYTSTPEDPNANIRLGGINWNGPHPIYYKTDPDPAKQVDLLVAVIKDLVHPALDAPIKYESLKFEHMLSNVKFSVKMVNQIVVNMGYSAKVTGAKIVAGSMNPYINGYLSCDLDNLIWYKTNSPSDVNLVTAPVDVTLITPKIIASTMQIPQTCGQGGAAIKVNYTIYKSGVRIGDYEKTFPRTSDTWVMGKVFNYQLTISPEIQDVVLSSSIEAWKTGNEIPGTI